MSAPNLKVEQMGLPLDGPHILTREDHGRLAKQRTTVLAYMAAGAWWTLRELSDVTGFPEASLSARLRDFRKRQYGAHKVERRQVGWSRGLFQYRLILSGSSHEA